MTKLDAKTIHWIKATLSNDEYATDEAMVAYFSQEGRMTQAEAEQWVARRMFYLGGNEAFHKKIAVLPRQKACPHCTATQMNVILYPSTWWLECDQCGDVISYEEKRAFSLNRTVR